MHDIHITRRDHISAGGAGRQAGGRPRERLRLAYVGRADPMKGPLDWIEVLERLAAAGVDFEATWLGDGADLAEMLRRVAAAGLGATGCALPGFAADRAAVFAALRAAHLFLFCHKTPESPRSLIEALVSGAPLVGYDSAYRAGPDRRARRRAAVAARRRRRRWPS